MSSSTTAARRLPARSAAPARSRPKLVVLAPQQVAGRTPFVMLVGGLLLAGLLALLMLHTLAAQDAFRQTALQQRLAALTDTEQSLEQKVQLDSSPTVLRERAKALGMVPSVVTSYHRLADGRVVAREVAASAVAAPTTTTSTAKSTATSTNSKAAATTPTTSTASTQTVSTKTVSTQTAPTSTTASKHRKHHGAARR